MKYTFDIEIYPNYFLIGFKEWKENNYIFFEIREGLNQRDEILKFINQKKLILIGFNSIDYDSIMLNGVKHFKTDTLEKLYKLNTSIIEKNYSEYSKYKYYKFNYLEIDLLRYWSKMLRLSKQISLKSLMVQLNMPLIQELPYKPNRFLTTFEMEEVKKYNVNDLDATEKLALKMEKEIKIRFSIAKERGFKCHSWDQIKLASEELLHSYCNQTLRNPNEVRKLEFSKPVLHLKELLKDINFNFKTPQFKNLLNNLNNSVNTFSEKFLFQLNNTVIYLSYGMGGIHSKNVNQKFFTDSKYQLLTSDIASLYPTLIINYKLIRFQEVLERYIEIKKERILAKHGKLEGKDNNLYNKFNKLVLNGVSGLLDQVYSWLYYPEGAMKLRLTGQLILTKLIEEATLANFNVVSTNTDGIEVLVEHERMDEYYSIVNEVESQFSVEFEHEFYNRIYYWSVNDYLAVIRQPTEILSLDQLNKEGYIKQKGMMVTNKPLGDSVDSLIIPKALNYYFIYGIPIEETIENETDIYLFCNSPKVSKKYTVYWNGEKQQQLNRYYVSTKGAYLYKQKKGGNLENLLKGFSVQILNDNRTAQKHFINYSYYISKCNEWIDKMEPKQLALF